MTRLALLAFELILIHVPAGRPDEKKPAYTVTRDGRPEEPGVIT